MSDEKQRLGERIRAARTAKGWKQKHLAARVDVEPITVSRWERGATSPDLHVINLVADATGKPLSYFVGGDEERAAAPASSTALDDAVKRIEAAALQIANEADRIAGLLEELRAGRDRPR
ncbi:MAG TPA: helix-turn-helix transcriptional regulator [Gaiellaceae bacterium]|nr:helix-turn-helix transcriptional regulator [Gaiellaceae bacterium]